MRKRTPKPYYELTRAEKLAEHTGAIARLELTLNTGQNRYGSYGDNVRAAIKRHKGAIEELSK